MSEQIKVGSNQNFFPRDIRVLIRVLLNGRPDQPNPHIDNPNDPAEKLLKQLMQAWVDGHMIDVNSHYISK